MVMVFGGDDDAGPQNGTYTFANNAWCPVSAANAPPARWDHNACWDELGSLMFIFGGKGSGGVEFNDMWVYSRDTNKWAERIPSGDPPPPRSGAGAAITSNNFFVLFGGEGTDGNPRDDIYICSTYYYNTWLRRNDCPISTRGAATAVDENLGYLLGYDANLYIWNIFDNTWTTLTQNPPYPEGIRYATVAQNDEKAWLFGGEQDGIISTVLKSTWEFDMATLSWTRREDMPEALTQAGAAWYNYHGPAGSRGASSGKVILFGGQRSDWSASSQTYEYLPVGYTSGASP